MSRHGSAHIDGGSRGNPGPGAYAFVLKEDSTGAIEERSFFLKHATNNFAEYTALIEVMKFALQLGYTHLKVHSDSELIVKQMNGEYKVRNADMIVFYQNAQELTKKFTALTIEHVRREFNKRADQLCNEEMDRVLEPNKTKPKKIKTTKPSRTEEPDLLADDSPRGRALLLIQSAAEAWQNGSDVQPLDTQLLDQLTRLLNSPKTTGD
jgi:ribonuclease HI